MDVVFLLELFAQRRVMGHGQPIHFVVLHVFLLRFGTAVAADEDHFELVGSAVAQLDQFRGECFAGRTPLGGEIKSDDFAGERGGGHFFAGCIDQFGTNEFFERGEGGEGHEEKEGEEGFHRFILLDGMCRFFRKCHVDDLRAM